MVYKYILLKKLVIKSEKKENKSSVNTAEDIHTVVFGPHFLTFLPNLNDTLSAA